MQTLYAMDANKEGTSSADALIILDKKIQASKELFTYIIFFVTEIARYAEVDAKHKASKYLPTTKDLNINTRIAGNQLLWKIIEEPSFKESLKNFKLTHIAEPDLIKKFYSQLVETPEYLEYIEIEGRDKKTERKIIEFIFTNLLLPSELFISHIEEHFNNWDDDAEMMQGLVINYFTKPESLSFNEFISKEKLEFANTLLKTVIDKSEFTLELIKPRLKNWDAERIAALDLIILQMGVCEFLYFETIPTKVTINEYIDLAKEYSTEQSGQFVNGLLDNIHKDLMAENKIEKQKYKNSTL